MIIMFEICGNFGPSGNRYTISAEARDNNHFTTVVTTKNRNQVHLQDDPNTTSLADLSTSWLSQKKEFYELKTS